VGETQLQQMENEAGTALEPMRTGPTLVLVPLTVRLTAASRDEFVQTYYPDIMQGGMFIRTEGGHALELGTRVELRYLLSDGQAVLRGQAVVAWVQRGGRECGLGVQFLRLSPTSHLVYREMLKLKRKMSAQLAAARQVESEFDDAPTRPMTQETARKLQAATVPGRPIRVTPHAWGIGPTVLAGPTHAATARPAPPPMPIAHRRALERRIAAIKKRRLASE
jgi:uncharacterized protein (TIGR02266 family)